jgi:ubiquinone/menaquinone biosynthesis C-methylase UbiE
VAEPFRKDLKHLSWEQVYARQVLRAELVNDWLDALRLKAAGRVLEIGAGPGYVSFALADRVGPGGTVYAIDRSAEALAYLARLQDARGGVPQIKRVVADAAALAPEAVGSDSALVSMVLHHTDDPAAILRSVARCVPENAPVVIGEFHPDGPCAVGPPREHRIAPEQVRQWCAQAGLTAGNERRQTPEHYMLVATRA